MIWVPGKEDLCTLICSSMTGLKLSSTLILIVPLVGESVSAFALSGLLQDNNHENRKNDPIVLKSPLHILVIPLNSPVQPEGTI